MTVIVILFTLLALSCIIVLMNDKIESYKLLGHLGIKNPDMGIFIEHELTDDDPLSIKYRDHRYDRHKSRRNFLSQNAIRNARSTDEL